MFLPATWMEARPHDHLCHKNGDLYFDTIVGHDKTIISCRRVIIQTATAP